MTQANIAAILAVQSDLETAYRKACDNLKAVPGIASGSMGLTPDHVKQSPEYRKAKYNADCAFLALRRFNSQYAKALAKARNVKA